MKPTMTAFDTNRRTDPSFNKPATTITMPVKIESVNNARAGFGPRWSIETSATMIAIAPVPCTAMNAEDVDNAPATVPTM